jgi:hypothetical protein
MKYTTYIISTLLIFTCITSNVFALKPSIDEAILDSISPVIHVGGGVQSINGILKLGLGNLISASFQALNGSNPKPSFFSSSSTPTSNNLFSVFQNSLFTQKVFVGFLPSEFRDSGIRDTLVSNYSSQRLNVKGGIAVKNLDKTNTGKTDRDVCVDRNGTLVLCQDVQTPPYTTLDWDGEPTIRCEEGKAISTWKVKGNEGKTVQFRRPPSEWRNATIGTNSIQWEMPKVEDSNDPNEYRFCKTLYYRVPDLPNKDRNNLENGIWGCVTTLTKEQCPDN